jgi:hypothetical protein
MRSLMEPSPLPCHPDRSEAERRDLRFRGPFVEVVFDRRTHEALFITLGRPQAHERNGEICGFPFGKAHKHFLPNVSLYAPFLASINL